VAADLGEVEGKPGVQGGGGVFKEDEPKGGVLEPLGLAK
jgi:hypothetical protein